MYLSLTLGLPTIGVVKLHDPSGSVSVSNGLHHRINLLPSDLLSFFANPLKFLEGEEEIAFLRQVPVEMSKKADIKCGARSSLLCTNDDVLMDGHVAFGSEVKDVRDD